MSRYEFDFNTHVVVDIDGELVPDNEFREWFYDFYTERQMAEWIAVNAARGWRPNRLDGLTEEEASRVKIVSIDTE